MTFASLDFLYFFLVVFVGYFTLPERWRNLFLLAASYFFYGYWSVKYLMLLIFTMALDYFSALMIDRESRPATRRLFLTASITLNLGILFVFKYFNFFSNLAATALGHRLFTVDLILPFGISFYTFHAMSYVIDVYRRVIRAERNFVYYSGYVMFFPQLVAGPIARASHLLHQFETSKRLKFDNLVEGSWLIAKGYVMKVVLADTIAPVVDAYLGTEMTTNPLLTLQGVYFFAFQIYFDFAGYTDIARGIAKLFDFDLVVNFARPYIAISITDFWRRWHISLSTWLRDYLYISLGGNRKGPFHTYRNLCLTMLLGGLWHGANLTFVVWGGLHGIYLVFEKLVFGDRAAHNEKYQGMERLTRQLITFHLVCFAWIFFRAPNLGEAWSIIRNIGTIGSMTAAKAATSINLQVWMMIVSWMSFEWCEAKLHLRQTYLRLGWPYRTAVMVAVTTFVILFAELNPKAFIYFQF